MARTVLVAAGGTGGHLFPGIAVADELVRRDASTRVVHFLATAADKVARGPAGHKLGIPPKELPGRVAVKPEQALTRCS